MAARVDALVSDVLAPRVKDVDQQGVYPRTFMQQLGTVGAYQAAHAGSHSVADAITTIESVSRACLSTGFCVWCQVVCGYYIAFGESQALKDTLLPKIASGEVLAGTGLSNPLKYFSGIEKIRLKAVRTEGGYIVNGTLPWVSNIAAGHAFAFVAHREGASAEGAENCLMAVASCDQEGVTLKHGGHFIALEGSSTYAVTFKDAFVADDSVLATSCDAYVRTVQPGFILMQTGMGLGLVASCLEEMELANRRVGHVNAYLDDTYDILHAELEALRERIFALAQKIDTGTKASLRESAALFQDTIRLRLAAAELSLRAAQAAMLHAGANGYRAGAVSERKLREAYFVAIVTPALKHLKKLAASFDAPRSALSFSRASGAQAPAKSPHTSNV